jgi:hypothetical protein
MPETVDSESGRSPIKKISMKQITIPEVLVGREGVIGSKGILQSAGIIATVNWKGEP